MIDTHSDEIHRMTPYQRCLFWLLGVVERAALPLLPRTLRHRLRVRVDRAQARLHTRVHDRGERL
jgi:hypothetical protein